MNNQTKFGAPEACHRKPDLVAYLYNEADASERASFERHLGDCGSCRDELRDFSRVRDDLSAWQVGFAPRTEVAFSRKWSDALRGLIAVFPIWARGAALTMTAAAILVLAVSFAWPRIGRQVEERTGGVVTVAGAVPAEQIEVLVKNAVAKEQARMEARFQSQMADFKQQLDAEHEAKMTAVKAGLKAEIRRANRQNNSIRSFFAMDDSQVPWGDSR